MKTKIGNEVIDTVIRFSIPDMPLPETEVVNRIARANLPILIMGESGTGKELLARAIHLAGPFVNGSFLTIDCAALSSSLIESELFGHVKGAFTGADYSRDGLLIGALGGTIFLDEIGELPLELQTKLLRAIQEREIRPVGSTKTVAITGRFIAATNRDLRNAVKRGVFREDLYYRLRGIALEVMPLRERREDIRGLVKCILQRLAGHDPALTVSEAAIILMKTYDWPGNVRELENVLQMVVALNPGARVIGPSNLPLFRRTSVLVTPTSLTMSLPIREVEKIAILHAMSFAEGNKIAAAKSLGIGKTTLYRKLKQYKTGS